MNRKTISILTFLACIALCAPLPLFSQDFEMKGTVLVKYNGNATNVTIPEGVTSIGVMAFFRNKTMVGITIPSSVASIGMWAFAGCSLPAEVSNDIVKRFGHGPFKK